MEQKPSCAYNQSMCGRYTLHPKAGTVEALIDFFQLPREIFALIQPRYNIAPTQPVLIVRQDNQKMVADHVLWGLIPSWSQDGKPNASLINARGETLAQKASFRNSYKRRRCIIPATGFYEWQTSGKTKQPYYITPKNAPLFAFAGLWDEWDGPNGENLRSCCVVTTQANSIMEKFHDRMPVILEKKDFSTWLSHNEDTLVVEPLLKSLDSAEMQTTPVSNFVSSARNEGPECIAPFDPPVVKPKRIEPTLFD